MWPGEEKAQQRDLIYGKCQERGCKKDGARLFSVLPCAKTRDSGHKVKHRGFPLNIRKHFCAVKMAALAWVGQRG